MNVISSVTSKIMPFGIPLRGEFPPKHMIQKPLDATVEELEARTKRLAKLENLYHKGQEAAWDGKQVLADLVAKHGGVHLPVEKRKALTNIFAILMWGELAAWEVASYLAENIRENTEAKMAATIQTFDEARHFYVLRDYLKLLNGDDAELPSTNSYVKSILMQVLATDSMIEKLIGMQLFVEHIAVHLFKHIAEVNVEPVLTELLPYFHRDESRHVALGKLFLPEKFRELSAMGLGRIYMYQLWLMSFMALSIEFHQSDAETLGLDTRLAMVRALRDQTHMIEDMGGLRDRQGALLLPKRLRFINRYLIKNSYPTEGEPQNIAFRYSRPLFRKFAESAERVWAVVA